MNLSQDQLNETIVDQLNRLQRQYEELQQSTNIIWILLGAGIVFFMQVGFLYLEIGFISKQYKEIQQIEKYLVSKTLINAIIAILCFYFIGYTISKRQLIHEGQDNKYYDLSHFCFQLSFLLAYISISHGGMAHKAQLISYFVTTPFLALFVYPVVVNLCWAKGGLLYELGYIDFAGSSIVHLAGGSMALILSMALGPSLGQQFQYKRFYNNKVKLYVQQNKNRVDSWIEEFKELKQNPNNFQICLGVIILWFGWLFFNSTSTKQLVFDERDLLKINTTQFEMCNYEIYYGNQVASKAFINSFLAPASGAFTAFIHHWLKKWRKHKECKHIFVQNTTFRPYFLMKGILAGLVAIAASCSYASQNQAIFIGCIAYIVYVLLSKLLKCLEIDDTSKSISVHLFCGAAGIIMAGIFTPKCQFWTEDEISQDRFWHTQIVVQTLGVIIIFGINFICGIPFMILVNWGNNFYTFRLFAEFKEDQNNQVANVVSNLEENLLPEESRQIPMDQQSINRFANEDEEESKSNLIQN